MTLTDPCPTTALSEGTNPFKTLAPHVYTLGDALPHKVTYDIDTIVNKASTVNCGTPFIVFVNEDDSTIDSAVFTEDRNTVNAYEFLSGAGPLTNIAKARDYNLRFKYYYSQQTLNVFTSDVFVVSIVDGCDPHLAGYTPLPVVIPATLTNQDYVITTTKQYVFPEFTTTPSNCASRLTYRWTNPADSSPSITGTQGDAVTFISNLR